jgi:hypothetical protein
MTREFARRCISTLLAVLPASCTNLPSTASVEGTGPATVSQTQTASCASFVELDVNLSGSGSASISVTDGTGKTVFAHQVPAQTDDTNDLSGAAGTWTLVVDATAFDGSYNVELQCP